LCAIIEELIVKVKIAAGTSISTCFPSAPSLRPYSPHSQNERFYNTLRPGGVFFVGGAKVVSGVAERAFPFTAATIQDDGLSKSEAWITGVVR
jgi:hypothetical protein